jgi:hypothetical protein
MTRITQLRPDTPSEDVEEALTAEGFSGLAQDNARRVQELAEKRIYVGQQLLEARLETLIDAAIGPDGQKRAALEWMHQLRVADVLDGIEKMVKDAQTKAQLIVPGSSVDPTGPGGLYVPGS